MSFIQENKILIDLNLKNEYHFIHFSDVHVININPLDEEKEYKHANDNEQAWYRVRKDFANYFHEKCDEEHMIPSTKCLDELLAYCNTQNIDALLMTGDIIDYYSKSNFEYLKNSLSSFNKPFIITCGNHEYPSSIFDELTNNSSDFQVLEFEDLKIIGLNDSTKKFSEKQYELLQKHCNDNKAIIICMHIPISTSYNQEEMKKYDSYFIINHLDCDETTKKVVDLFINNDNIKTILCGHTHGASQSYFAEGKKQICASSGLIGYLNNITIK